MGPVAEVVDDSVLVNGGQHSLLYWEYMSIQWGNKKVAQIGRNLEILLFNMIDPWMWPLLSAVLIDSKEIWAVIQSAA